MNGRMGKITVLITTASVLIRLPSPTRTQCLVAHIESLRIHIRNLQAYQKNGFSLVKVGIAGPGLPSNSSYTKLPCLQLLKPYVLYIACNFYTGLYNENLQE